MSVSVKFKPIDRDVLFDLVNLTPQEQSAALAEFARQEIAAAERQNEDALGHAVSHEIAVDGSRGAPLSSVRPNGVIVATFDLGSDVVSYVWQQVQQHAPVLTGKFRRSIRIYVDNVEVDGPDKVDLNADEIVITSVAPYARKLEGLAGKKHMSEQAPKGVFEAVAAIAAARYGNQARVRYTMRSPIGGDSSLENWARRHASRTEGTVARRRQYQKNVRQPAILITFK